MKFSFKDVSIVIPNWNGLELIKVHLPKILTAAKGVSEIIVVDDDSRDQSVLFLKKEFPMVKVIQKQKHEGFASTVNIGVGSAKGDIVLLLNTDVEPEPGFLSPLLSHFSDPMVFAVGCMDKSMENGLTVLRGRGQAAWEKGFYIHWRGEIDKSDTAWVSCGSGAFRKDIWKKLGGLDTLYNPFYWEDIDLSCRATKAGYTLIFEAKSVVVHYHEEGKIKQQFSEHHIRAISYRNQFIFIWKNLSDWSLWLEHILWTPIRLVQSLVQGDTSMMYGYILGLFMLPAIIIHRYEK